MSQFILRPLWQHLQSWFNQAQAATISDNSLELLPDPLNRQLAQKLKTLTSPQPYQTGIQDQLKTALAEWQQNLDAPNALVILGNPVEPIGQILQDSLQAWPDSPVEILSPLPCLNRPTDPLNLTQQIHQRLQPYAQITPIDAERTDDPQETESLEQRVTLIMVPCLEQCFLRCIDGWNGIEFLRDMAVHNRNCFWLFGCNHWAWNFLDFVCQISAYFSETYPLPHLDGEDLQTWLDPVISTVIKTDDHKDADNPLSYWGALATQSGGMSHIAAQLWLQSLRIQPEIIEADESQPQLSYFTATEDEASQGKLCETSPVLPSLPSLLTMDRYLLHSLLIHGPMTRPHLALSLGEPESQIQSRIQWLLRMGLLQRGAGTLSVKAAHYTKLKTELANNNFFVGEDA